MIHCLFEQSGTFRDAFINMGYLASDYDIEDQFHKTDIQCDLFKEIECAYVGLPSIFDNMVPDDFIVAFFPCTRFETMSMLVSRCDGPQYKDYSDIRKLHYSLDWFNDLASYYRIFCHLFVVVLKRGLRMVVENPSTTPNFLNSYFPIEPTIIETDRRVLGDKFRKPTAFWFVNCSPCLNPVPLCDIQDYIRINQVQGYGAGRALERSLITPLFAENFIKKYLIGII